MIHYEWDFHFLLQYRALILKGIGVTVGSTLLTCVLGLLVGLLIAIGRLTGRRLIAAPLVAVVELFRCTPVLVQLIWSYYGLLITSATYRPLEAYTMVAVIYFALLFPLTRAAQWVERRYAKADPA